MTVHGPGLDRTARQIDLLIALSVVCLMGLLWHLSTALHANAAAIGDLEARYEAVMRGPGSAA